MEKKGEKNEVEMMEALSFAMYGRGSQNRCSTLTHTQQEQLKMAARNMLKEEKENTKNGDNAPPYPLDPSINS